MDRLHNESVLITGGASGLGLAVAQRCLEDGALVTVFDKSSDANDKLLEQLRRTRYNERLTTFAGDVRSFSDNEAAVAVALEKFDKLDCVIGNAGIWDFSIPLVDMPVDSLDQSFDELFHVNVKGYLLLAKAALTPLARSKGSIIYTVSNAGFHPAGGGPLYTATKHAVTGLIKQLAYELAPHIRVNGVAPGAIQTNLRGPLAMGMQERVIPGEALSKSIPDRVPVGVMPTPEEYAGAYIMFASRRDNIPTTGSILNHDGGMAVRGFGRVRGGDQLIEKLGLD